MLMQYSPASIVRLNESGHLGRRTCAVETEGVGGRLEVVPHAGL